MRLERQVMRRWLTAVVLTLAMLVGNVGTINAVPLQAQTAVRDTATPSEKAKLWVKDYRRLHVVVEDVPVNNIGLEADSIRTKAELRLRSAGIRPVSLAEYKTDPSADYYLWVQVNVVGAAYNINLSFNRITTWTLPNDRSFSFTASTWVTSGTGTQSRIGSVMEALDRNFDIFLNAYLKANQ
jgi:hypothetical protein